MLEILKHPWPWYVAGPLLGLTIPFLLLFGNKSLGISSSLRHICAACLPAGIKFFEYDWRREQWNLLFVAGLIIGGSIAATALSSPEPLAINPKTFSDLQEIGLATDNNFMPESIFSFNQLLTLNGFIFIVIGGFLVGFGTRYAGGCTSGHTIMGLSTLQWPSLVATIAFMAGGFLATHFILPLIIK